MVTLGLRLYVFNLLLSTNFTCGTHFGETKLVASMTESPESDNMSMRRIFTSAGTMVCVCEREGERNTERAWKEKSMWHLFQLDLIDHHRNLFNTPSHLGFYTFCWSLPSHFEDHLWVQPQLFLLSLGELSLLSHQPDGREAWLDRYPNIRKSIWKMTVEIRG